MWKAAHSRRRSRRVGNLEGEKVLSRVKSLGQAGRQEIYIKKK